jgi:hypothetical protein
VIKINALSKLFKKDLEAIIKSALLILNNESITILLCLKGAVVVVIVW